MTSEFDSCLSRNGIALMLGSMTVDGGWTRRAVTSMYEYYRHVGGSGAYLIANKK